MKLRTVLSTILFLALFATASFGQATNPVVFSGQHRAISYGYGTSLGAPNSALIVGVGTAGTGSQTITVQFGFTVLTDGRVINPLATNTPVTLGGSSGGTLETVTPSAVSCTTPTVYNTCTFTATFTYTHAAGENVSSGTYGLQEAINASNVLGGTVVVDSAWASAGGTNAIIQAAAGFAKVSIQDTRGTGTPWWTLQPTTLTVLAAPTTLTATNIVFTVAPVGTWAASSTHFLATCVDALGGESAGSADYTQTPTVNYTLTVAVPPTCATGAVGWRIYAGTTSAAVSYLLPITSANCTLTTLESVIAACALTSTGTWSPTFTTTTAQVPLALGVVNQINPVPQGHTTFGYQPSGSAGTIFQTHYGPFGSGTVATATAAQNTVLGTVHLPPAYLNYIGRTIRVTGKIDAAATAGGTLVINGALGWAGGDTAGAPVPVCIDTTTSALGTQTYTIAFSCTLTTNAVGATAVGSEQADSWLIAGGPSTTNIVGTDTGAAAVGSLGLFSQNDLYIYLTPATHDLTAVRLMDLHVETLQ